jgi:hypothetical protein
MVEVAVVRSRQRFYFARSVAVALKYFTHSAISGTEFDQ